MHRAVVTPTEQHQVVERRPAPVGPMLDVMGVAAAVAAAGEATLPVADRQRPAECGREGARAAADVEDFGGGPVGCGDGQGRPDTGGRRT